jgi:hypothetical protein
MTALPPEITRNLDAHRTALAFIRAMLTDRIDDALELWFTCPEDQRIDIGFALATQAAAYLSARCGGGEAGGRMALRYADETLLAMAQEDGG